MNDPEPPAGPIQPISRKVYRDLVPLLFDRLCELFPAGITSEVNIIRYIIMREKDIRRGSWMLVHDNMKPSGVTTIEINARLSDIWPQSKS